MDKWNLKKWSANVRSEEYNFSKKTKLFRVIEVLNHYVGIQRPEVDEGSNKTGIAFHKAL